MDGHEAEPRPELLRWDDQTRKVLSDIKSGRQAARENQHINDQLQAASCERADALASVTEWIPRQNEIGDETTENGKEARRRFTEELERRNSRERICNERATDLYKKQGAAFAFTVTFDRDVRQLLPASAANRIEP